MAKISFRTADGKKVSFTTKSRKNPKRKVAKKSAKRKTTIGSTWKAKRAANGRTYYIRCVNGRNEIKWGKNGKIIRLAKPFKKGGGRRKTCKKRASKKRAASSAKVTIPKGKTKGQRFTKNGVQYVVSVRKTASGGYKRYARKA